MVKRKVKLRSILLDDDLDEKILKFQEYMNRESRAQMSFSRTVNFLVDLALSNLENGGENKIEQQQ